MAQDANTARELATHETEIRHLQADLDKVMSDVADIRMVVHDIQNAISKGMGESEGSKKTWATVAAIAGILSGVVVALIQTMVN